MIYPINVLLLLDTSSSVAVNGELVKAAAAEFLESVVSEKDRVALVQFATTSRVVVPLTGDRDRLRQSIDAIWMGGGTAFRDALVTGLYYLSGARGRRAVVVLSDGLDEHSILSQRETLQFAQRAGIAVYTVGLGLQVSSAINRPLGGGPRYEPVHDAPGVHECPGEPGAWQRGVVVRGGEPRRPARDLPADRGGPEISVPAELPVAATG